MWDEDPSFQAAQWQLLRSLLLGIVFLVVALALLTWDWSPIKYVLGVAVLIGGALVLYATVTWLTVNAIKLLQRAFSAFVRYFKDSQR